jgi:2-isopropylmalate synthase
MHRVQHGPLRYFELIQFRVVDEKGYMRREFGANGACHVKTDERIEHDPASAWAAVMLAGPNGEIEHTAAEGNGPVNALDTALRRALRRFYPNIEEMRLLDYKVRVLGGDEGSAAPVRVLIESGDGRDRWGTVGVSLNVIEASWQALVDSFEYKIYKDAKRARRAKSTRRRGRATAGR